MSEPISVDRRYSFFQAVRTLERAQPDRVPIGHLGPAANEALRLCHDPHLVFATGDVAGFEWHRGQARLTTTFLGLTGTVSPFATCLVEELSTSDDSATEPLRAFYDLFHHRLLSFVYRGWLKYRPLPQYRSEPWDPFTRRVLALLGVAPDAPQPRGALPPFVQLSLAPVLAGRSRSGRALLQVLTRAFPGVHFGIEAFVERKVALDPSQRSRLGQLHTTLGEDFTIGRRVSDRAGRFRVLVGPVDQETSERFLPGGKDFPYLRGVVEHFTRGVLEGELEIELDQTAIPRFQLASRYGSTLGVTTRLGTKRQARTRLRVVLSEELADLRPTIVADA